MRRRSKIILGVLAGLPLAALAAGFIVLPRVDLGAFAAARASAALGRGVAIDSLRVSPGLMLGVELRGLRLDNIEGGTRPAMAEFARLSAAIELLPLLRGAVVVRRAEGEGFSLLLERTAERRANWHFGDRPASPPAAAPPDRSGFPMLHEVTLTGSDITFRTTGGAMLRTVLDVAVITAAAVDQPAALRAQGSYNGVALTLEGALGSIATLRDAATPFPMTLRATAPDTWLLAEGTATDPLNVDGLEMRLTLVGSSPRDILAMAGADPQAGPQVAAELAGALTRQGDLWRLTAAQGSLDGTAFTAPLLELREGAAGQPDAITAEATIARLDVNRLLGAPPASGEGAHGDADLPLVVPAQPDPLLRVRLGAAELVYAAFRGTEVRLEAVVEPGRIALENVAVQAFGAALSGSAELTPAEGGGTQVSADVEMREGDVDTLRRAFGLHAVPLSGRLEGRFAVAAQATTLNEATQQARISAVVSMPEGRIAHEVIEMASTDLRALFRTSTGTTRVSCLLAAIDMRAGRGQAAPLRIRAGTGTISGIASFDLNSQTLDLIIGSQSDTTDFFALDIPVQVSGSFADPSIAPAQWSREARARMSRNQMAPLPPDLRAVARANPCYSGQSLRR